MGYPSDLTDEQWNLIAHLLEKKTTGCFIQKYAKRDLLNGILYINKTGGHWRYLPKDYPPWSSVYQYFKHLSRKKMFEYINSVLSVMIRANCGRALTPSLVCIDSQCVKGDVNIHEKGFNGHKKVHGRKRHIFTDVLGLIVCCLITPANTADVKAGNILIKKAVMDTIKKVLGDTAYNDLELPEGVELEISAKPPSSKGFVPLKIRWVVERTFAWLSRQRRLAKDYEVRIDHQESMVYVGMLKIMLKKVHKSFATKGL